MKFMYYRNLVGAVLTEEEAKADAEEVICLVLLHLSVRDWNVEKMRKSDDLNCGDHISSSHVVYGHSVSAWHVLLILRR